MKIVDMQEICNLLIENNYRLIKVDGADAASMQGNAASLSGDVASDPLLERELKDARRRAENARLERDVGRPGLVKALKRWRIEKAKELALPTYIVLANRTLLLIAGKAPATLEELQEVSGFGPAKADKYGEDILAIVVAECEVIAGGVRADAGAETALADAGDGEAAVSWADRAIAAGRGDAALENEDATFSVADAASGKRRAAKVKVAAALGRRKLSAIEANVDFYLQGPEIDASRKEEG